jgi:hypothetical protein
MCRPLPRGEGDACVRSDDACEAVRGSGASGRINSLQQPHEVRLRGLRAISRPRRWSARRSSRVAPRTGAAYRAGSRLRPPVRTPHVARAAHRAEAGLRPPVETGGWNFGKSAFADCTPTPLRRAPFRARADAAASRGLRGFPSFWRAASAAREERRRSRRCRSLPQRRCRNPARRDVRARSGHGACRANKFAATTARSPPSRTAGRHHAAVRLSAREPMPQPRAVCEASHRFSLRLQPPVAGSATHRRTSPGDESYPRSPSSGLGTVWRPKLARAGKPRQPAHPARNHDRP